MNKPEEITKDNPYGVCTWKDASNCEKCKIEGKLKCRFKLKHLLFFIGAFLLMFIPGVIGMILAGFGWFILGWIGFALFFFNIWESKILCSHCPFYAERGNTLHCIANYGSYKPWKYNPVPMSRSEKFQLIIGFIILGCFPFPFLFFGQEFLFLFITSIGLLSFFAYLKIKVCSKCVNFSCPFNSVKKEIVDDFLKKNRVMKKAWEEEGYILDE
ncbi:MAG: hypothetical protein GF383_11495 [Candidatus Lokiarchaeota archaeon]|nr:hypothetical protein [Candidatus Lokiarchaeota archaeon]MBD3341348.1 hypothetical protein [Candidatus Lokiarchaeota archaeon]